MRPVKSTIEKILNEHNKNTSRNEIYLFGNNSEQIAKIEEALCQGPSDYFRLEAQRKNFDIFLSEMATLEKKAQQAQQEFLKAAGLRVEICLKIKDISELHENAAGFSMRYGNSESHRLYIGSDPILISEFNQAVKKTDSKQSQPVGIKTKSGAKVIHDFDLVDVRQIRAFRRRVVLAGAMFLLSSNCYVIQNRKMRLLTNAEVAGLLQSYMSAEDLTVKPNWLNSDKVIDADSFRSARDKTVERKEFCQFMFGFARAWSCESLSRWEWARSIWPKVNKMPAELNEILIRDLWVAASKRPLSELHHYVWLWAQTPGIIEWLRQSSIFFLLKDELQIVDQSGQLKPFAI